MVRINRIYTRTGDKGETGLVGGSRVRKDHDRIALLGEVDELNAHLGLIRTLLSEGGHRPQEAMVARIQNELFDIGAELATPPDARNPSKLITENSHVTRLEGWIDALNDSLPELTSFVLPGGTVLNAEVHVARTVCRRLERSMVGAAAHLQIGEPLLAYVNRLSDLLFALARWISHHTGTPEFLWVPGKDRDTLS